MGKSWLYRRLRSGEIPSVRLGRTIKVRREELEEHLQSHHYPARLATSVRSEPSSLGDAVDALFLQLRPNLFNIDIVDDILNGETIKGCELPGTVVDFAGNTP
jgi:excisionase family DNA binding protein